MKAIQTTFRRGWTAQRAQAALVSVVSAVAINALSEMVHPFVAAGLNGIHHAAHVAGLA